MKTRNLSLSLSLSSLIYKIKHPVIKFFFMAVPQEEEAIREDIFSPFPGFWRQEMQHRRVTERIPGLYRNRRFPTTWRHVCTLYWQTVRRFY